MGSREAGAVEALLGIVVLVSTAFRLDEGAVMLKPNLISLQLFSRNVHFRKLV